MTIQRFIRTLIFSMLVVFLPSIATSISHAACGTLTTLFDPSTYGGSGTSLTDQSGCSNNGTIVNGTPSRTTAPARFILNQGSSGQNFYVNNQYSNPSVYSIAVWFRTTVAGGTKIMGFVQSTSTAESNYDRHLYIGTDGKLYYGVYNGAVITIASSYAVNDGKWHLAAATQSGTAGKLYLDSITVGTLSAQPQTYNGYWKVGGYKLTSWNGPGGLGDADWVGDIGKVYVYATTQITDTDVATIYNTGKPMYVTPTTSIALSSGTSAIYRTTSNVQLTSGVDGKVTFYQGGKKIPGCQSISTSSGTAICPWKPSVISLSSLYAKLVPVDTGFATMTSSTIQVPVSKRTGNR